MKLNFIDLDLLFEPKDVVTNPKSVDNRGTFNEDGIFSKSIFGDLKSSKYECKCGILIGKFQEGNVCPDCETKVTKVKSIGKIGWINFDKNFLIQPIFYNFLLKVMPIDKIINFELKIDEDGALDRENVDIYNNIGILDFKRKFFEILEYFEAKDKNGNRAEYFKIIRDNYDKIFISNVPVYNTKLRPALMVGGSKLVYEEVNKFYTLMLTTLEVINENDDGDEKFILPLLYQAQNIYLQLADYVIDNISTKSGIIRNNLLGFRINFSSRSTITPLSIGYKINEVSMPYVGFLELYKFHILNLLTKIHNISYIDALDKWFKAVASFDQEIYNIMDEIIVKGNAAILLNRKYCVSY